MFLPKFDTKNHPLFAQCGSKYPGYRQNCTNVEEVYAPVWEKRLESYNEMYNLNRDADEVSKQDYEEQIETENAAEQQHLEEEFTSNNPIQAPELEPTEEEYAKYAYSADRADYEPVDDFDDDDSDFEDIAPIVGELMTMMGDDE